MGILVALGYGARQRLVTVGGRLHGVVVVPGQHTCLELADHLGALADRTHILRGNGAHTRHARLAGVPVGRAVLAVPGDRLASPALNIA